MMTKKPKLKMNHQKASDAEIFKGMKASKLKALFEEHLNDIRWSESALLDVLKTMSTLASTDELIGLLTNYSEVTQRGITRVNELFTLLKRKSITGKSNRMELLISEANELLTVCEKGPSGDAVIISTIQKLQHYEIAVFSTLLEFAKVIGLSETEQSIRQTLNEQKKANQKLINMAVLFGMNMERLFRKVHQSRLTQHIE